MAQYNITATSAKLNTTVSNTNSNFVSPAEFANKAAADLNAAAYAEDLNHDDYNGAWDWVGTATTV